MARKFSPILVLTQETGGQWGDIRVTEPGPVEIVGADSASNIWLEVNNLNGDEHVTSAPLDLTIFDPAAIRFNQHTWYPDGEVDFDENRFAFLDHRDLRTYNALREGLTPGSYSTRAFF